MKLLALASLFAMVIASCVVRRISGPRLTGTCIGACAHYIECKDGHLETDRTRCQSECPLVLGDADSLMAYESLTCADAVEFVDGNHPRSASQR